MASGAEAGRRAGRALAGAKARLQREAASVTATTRELAAEVRARVEASRARAGPAGWRPARMAAGVAGLFLVWRALFGRGLARIPAAVAGVLVLRAAFGKERPRGGERRRRPEVIEAKSPSELEPGIASASPKPTFASRVDRGERSGSPTRGDGH